MSKIQFRRGTSTEWSTANTVLASGELGFETDTGKYKIGVAGGTAWNDLGYALSGAYSPTQYSLSFGTNLTGTVSEFNGSTAVTVNLDSDLTGTNAASANYLSSNPLLNGQAWDGNADRVIKGAIFGQTASAAGNFRNIYISPALSAPSDAVNGDVWIAY